MIYLKPYAVVIKSRRDVADGVFWRTMYVVATSKARAKAKAIGIAHALKLEQVKVHKVIKVQQ